MNGLGPVDRAKRQMTMAKLVAEGRLELVELVDRVGLYQVLPVLQLAGRLRRQRRLRKATYGPGHTIISTQ